MGNIKRSQWEGGHRSQENIVAFKLKKQKITKLKRYVE